MNLNKYGVLEGQRPRMLSPTVPKGKHYLANEGGFIRPAKGQTGWRIYCRNVGRYGGFEIDFGGTNPIVIDHHGHRAVDLTIAIPLTVHIRQVGMLSGDWHALVISRVV